jgi:integrase
VPLDRPSSALQNKRLDCPQKPKHLKVLDACPNNQWRLLFALSRFGGLRCPSEHRELKWSDIDLKHGRMTVRSPKTEHHDGRESRVCPIFPELRPYLEAARKEADKGCEYVITIPNVRADKYANPRSTMQKIIRRAGLEPWPKLFQNLRSSCETELAAEHPIHVVCEWIGNTPKVAAEHYLRVTDADYDKANGKAAKSAGMGAGTKAQDRAQGHTPPQAATLRKIIANVLKEKGLDAKPSVISELAARVAKYPQQDSNLQPSASEADTLSS